jgi:hypothetical protein
MSNPCSRRSVLGAMLGIAGGAGLAALAPTVRAPARAAATRSAPRLLIVQDGRYAASRRHADRYARQALRVVDARDDLARLWYGGLAHAATTAPLVIRGLTTWSDYVVLRGCAAESGLRAARAELIRAAGGRGCTLVRWQIGGTPT